MRCFIFIIILILCSCQTVTDRHQQGQSVSKKNSSKDIQQTFSNSIAPNKSISPVRIVSEIKEDVYLPNYEQPKTKQLFKEYLEGNISVNKPMRVSLISFDGMETDSNDTLKIFDLKVISNTGDEYSFMSSYSYDKKYLFRGNTFVDTIWNSNDLPGLIRSDYLTPFFIKIKNKKYLAIMASYFRATGIGVNKSTCVFWDLDTGAYYQSDSFLCSADCFNDFDGDGKLNFLSFNLQDRTIVKGEKMETWYYTMQNLAVLGDTLLPIASPFDSLLLEEKRLGHFKMLKK